ncbi:MAG: LLM class flavin-dependent oxidoreductase, partial [Alphaproteobacteria bacterium]|nr:LLM class flavin-dependent oxidoreductase [Alphaproteobacteria bacterium]
LKPPRLICAGMSPRGFDFSVRHTDGCFIGGRDAAQTREASLRAKDLAARLGKTIRTYAMITVIWDESDAAAEQKAARYREGLDEGAVAGMLESYGAAGNAMTARAQGAFMTQTAIGAPATCAEKIETFLMDCALDGLMFIFDDYPRGLAMAGAEILPRLRKASV